MRKLTPLLLVLGASLANACESGWDVEGRVLTAAVKDRDRSLAVYLLNFPQIDPAQLPTDPLAYDLLAQVDELPAQELPFRDSEFGCHRGSVLVVAWAPRRTGAGEVADAGASAGGPRPFKPVAGDIVATSDVRHPYCGVRTMREQIDVTLPAIAP
jgi:hypothetical protein